MIRTKLLSANENDTLLLQYISGLLLDLGFRLKLKGFIYTKEAIYLYTKFLSVNSISKNIYSEIAKKYNVSVTSIDCSIKKSIESAWHSDKLNKANMLFKCSCIKFAYPPTNSEFIATMAEIIKIATKKEQF